MSLYFVYRTPWEGPLGKRVRRLPDTTVLGWLRRLRGVPTGERIPVQLGDRLTDELGGHVYGCATLGVRAPGDDAGDDPRLARVAGLADARDFLVRHLYQDECHVDERSVRVCTDDDEADLAWFVFDEDLARRYPDRVAFLLHDGPGLPDGAGTPAAAAAFRPVGEPLIEVDAGVGPGRTFVVDLELQSSAGFDDMAYHELRGARLPELSAAGDWVAGLELDEDLGREVTRAVAGGAGAHAVAIRHGDSNVFLFDDLWAGAYPDLAASLLRYVETWDPLAELA